MTRKLFWLMTAFTVVTLSQPGFAQVPSYPYGPGWGMGPPMRMPPPGMGMPHPGMGMTTPGTRMRGMGWRLNMLNLSDEQLEKIKGIFIEMRKKHLELTSQLWDEQAKLQDLHGADTLDPKAVGEAYSRFFDIKRQMIESMVEAHNQRLAVLTEEQRSKLKEMHSQAWGPLYGRGGVGQGQ